MQEQIDKLQQALNYIESQAKFALMNLSCSVEVENIFKNISITCWENKVNKDE